MTKIYSPNAIMVLIFTAFFTVAFTSTTPAADTVITNKEVTAEQSVVQMANVRQISADTLKWEYEAGTALFTGNVVMKAEEGEIRCSKMTAVFDQKDEIEKMSAEENATLNRENQKGGAKIIDIYPDKNLIILRQEAWISSDKATFQGEEIIFDTEKEIINITKGVKGEIKTGNEETPK